MSSLASFSTALCAAFALASAPSNLLAQENPTPKLLHGIVNEAAGDQHAHLDCVTGVNGTRLIGFKYIVLIRGNTEEEISMYRYDPCQLRNRILAAIPSKVDSKTCQFFFIFVLKG